MLKWKIAALCFQVFTDTFVLSRAKMHWVKLRPKSMSLDLRVHSVEVETTLKTWEWKCSVGSPNVFLVTPQAISGGPHWLSYHDVINIRLNCTKAYTGLMRKGRKWRGWKMGWWWEDVLRLRRGVLILASWWTERQLVTAVEDKWSIRRMDGFAAAPTNWKEPNSGRKTTTTTKKKKKK